MTLRSAIDAAHERALNTRNLALAVGIAVLTVGGTWFAGGSTLAVVKAAVAPFFLLGVLTLWSALFLTRTVQHRAGHATQPEPAATRG
jgi:fatty acid desaturase